MSDVTYTVVVPVYRNEATLSALLLQMAELVSRLDAPFEAIFVIDGSPDNSYALLQRELPHLPFASQLIALTRNFGSFAAIRAGFAAARGEYIAFLAADLQQPVSSVEHFFALLRGGADIAIGQRSDRDDPLLSRWTSALFWTIYRRFVQRDVPAGGVDAFGCTRDVRNALVALPEANTTLVGLLLWIGYRRAYVTYPRAARASGRSGWTLGRKFRYAFDSLFAFSDLPITAMMAIGGIGIATALLASVIVLVTRLKAAPTIDAGAQTLASSGVAPGYTALMLALLWSVSLILLALGVIGGYLWRVFENTKSRPSYLVKSTERYGAHASKGVEAS